MEEITKKLNLNWTEIENCVKTKGEQLLLNDIKESEKYNAQASPTVFINNVQYYGNRTAQAYEEAICKSYANCTK
jgi:protein-disulfide isomerase